MKVQYWLLLIGILAIHSCVKESTCNIVFGVPVNIDFKKTACSQEGNFLVTFDSIVTESRCPLDATCIWEGYAQIQLKLSIAGNVTKFSLATINTPLLNTDTTLNGFHFHLNKLTPFPSVKVQPSQQEYSAEIVVSR